MTKIHDVARSLIIHHNCDQESCPEGLWNRIRSKCYWDLPVSL